MNVDQKKSRYIFHNVYSVVFFFPCSNRLLHFTFSFSFSPLSVPFSFPIFYNISSSLISLQKKNYLRQPSISISPVTFDFSGDEEVSGFQWKNPPRIPRRVPCRVVSTRVRPPEQVEIGGDGKAIGVTSEGETAKCKKVVCDPSYLPDKVKKVGKVARAICLMNHPIPNTVDAHSVQIILPQKQIKHKSDMYLFCCSYSHNVVPKGKYIAFVTTEAETDNPEAELKPGIDLLGSVEEIFFDTYDRYEPTNLDASDNCFISTSYDATTHFESTVDDVIAMYKRITGKDLDLSVDLSAASAAEE